MFNDLFISAGAADKPTSSDIIHLPEIVNNLFADIAMNGLNCLAGMADSKLLSQAVAKRESAMGMPGKSVVGATGAGIDEC